MCFLLSCDCKFGDGFVEQEVGGSLSVGITMGLLRRYHGIENQPGTYFLCTAHLVLSNKKDRKQKKVCVEKKGARTHGL